MDVLITYICLILCVFIAGTEEQSPATAAGARSSASEESEQSRGAHRHAGGAEEDAGRRDPKEAGYHLALNYACVVYERNICLT